jgi:hypothetical protein
MLSAASVASAANGVAQANAKLKPILLMVSRTIQSERFREELGAPSAFETTGCIGLTPLYVCANLKRPGAALSLPA